MTDEQIIKALECLMGEEILCKECAYLNIPYPACKARVANNALDLINRLKAENERLKKHNTEMARKHFNDGVIAFAERLKEYSVLYSYITPRDIDNLVKNGR